MRHGSYYTTLPVLFLFLPQFTERIRFNELCALKEFIPQQTNANTVAKSQELFSREAAILYKIQHPQIPKFRATFEEHQRLFLLQDYVEGKTYRTILQERQVTNSLFSEVEVLTFLRQMLSVLAYIHNFGIIHRDISPENIIRRETDKIPVMSILTENEALIDEVSEQVSIWKGKLPTDGDYKIILTPLPNLSGTDYKLDINLINPIPKFTPTSEPRVIDSPAPTSELEAIDLPTPASEAEAIDLPTPASEPQGKEFPASVPLNKPAKEQIATPAPIPLNKPVNKQIVTPAPGATPLKKFNKSSKKEAVGPEATKTE